MNDRLYDRDPQTAHFLQSSNDGAGTTRIIVLIDAIRDDHESIIAL